MYINKKNKREIKGALTNTASFDDNELNMVKYKDGEEIDDGVPKILKQSI
jgi:hypothetical protein